MRRTMKKEIREFKKELKQMVLGEVESATLNINGATITVEAPGNYKEPKYTLRTLPKEVVKEEEKELETKIMALYTELEESDISKEIKDKIHKLCRLYVSYCTEE